MYRFKVVFALPLVLVAVLCLTLSSCDESEEEQVGEAKRPGVRIRRLSEEETTKEYWQEMVACWPMDEGRGDYVEDVSGNGNRGHILGGVKWVEGISGTALEFDGISGWLNCGKDASLYTTKNQCTLMFWFKPTADINPGDPRQNPVYHAGAPMFGFNVMDAWNVGARPGVLTAWTDGPGGAKQTILTSKRTSWKKGEWHHAAYVYDGSECRLYVDGHLEDSRPGNGEIKIYPNYLFAIGADSIIRHGSPINKYYFKGVVDEVKYWRRPLSRHEILEFGSHKFIELANTITGGDGAPMMFIPAGEFLMGNFQSTRGDHDKPIHNVYLDAYYIDSYEVTNAQYARFLNEYGKNVDAVGHELLVFDGRYCLIEKAGNVYRPKAGYADHPAICITWYGAAMYAQFYNKRLPTEAEWEKAARGGLVGRIYPGGDTITRNDANYSGTGGKDIWDITAPVGSFAPNGYGLYDVSGNAVEWCADKYDKGYYSRSPRKNPPGPGVVITFRNDDFAIVDPEEYRVRRGALWKTAPEGTGVGRRGYGRAGDIYYVPGFRTVQDIES